MSLRLGNAVRFFLLLSLVLALAVSASANTLIGSATTSRPFVDLASGQVYIYAGGNFEPGVTVQTFHWLGDLFAGSGFLTPLLFEETSPGVYTVEGIGTGQTVTSSGSVQSFAFGLTAGTDTTTNGNWTFGFINGLVNTAGSQTNSSAGTVDVSIPADGLSGIAAATTDNWLFTPSDANVTVGIGTTFGSGVAADFALNNPGLGGANQDRTYSATLSGIITVAEPGTFSLITGAGLVLAGMFRYRYVRRRRS